MGSNTVLNTLAQEATEVLQPPTFTEQGTNPEVAHKWADWLHNPCHLGVPDVSKQGTGVLNSKFFTKFSIS